MYESKGHQATTAGRSLPQSEQATPSEFQANAAPAEAVLNDLVVHALEEPDDLVVSNGRGEQLPHQVLLSRLVEAVHDEYGGPRFKSNGVGVKLFVSHADDAEEVPA